MDGVLGPWAVMVERWHDTSTLTPKVRGGFRSIVAKAGRWLAAEHPEIVQPARWTRETCAAWVAALDRMTVGEYVLRYLWDAPLRRRVTAARASLPDRVPAVRCFDVSGSSRGLRSIPPRCGAELPLEGV